MEYEYTIDGGTGQILEYDREQDDWTQTGGRMDADHRA